MQYIYLRHSPLGSFSVQASWKWMGATRVCINDFTCLLVFRSVSIHSKGTFHKGFFQYIACLTLLSHKMLQAWSWVKYNLKKTREDKAKREKKNHINNRPNIHECSAWLKFQLKRHLLTRPPKPADASLTPAIKFSRIKWAYDDSRRS